MRSRNFPTYIALVALVFLSERITAADDPNVDACPGAQSWSRSHPSPSRSPPSSTNDAIADADLLRELQTRFEKDQAARRLWLANLKSDDLARSVDVIDAANLAWLRELVLQEGFPTAAQVGSEGVHLAWVL